MNDWPRFQGDDEGEKKLSLAKEHAPVVCRCGRQASFGTVAHDSILLFGTCPSCRYHTAPHKIMNQRKGRGRIAALPFP